MPIRHQHLHRSPDAGDGGTGGGSSSPQHQTTSPNPPAADAQRPRGTTRLWSPEVEGKFQSKLAAFGGDPAALARALWGEVYDTRQRAKQLRNEVEALRTRNPQGSVVLIGEQVTDWNAYQQLGKVADVKTKLEQAAQTAQQLAAAQRKDVRAKAAQALGFHVLTLSDRLDLTQLDVEIRDEAQADGTKRPVPYARQQGDANAAWEPLATIATRDWADYLPALRAVAPTHAGGASPTPPAGDPAAFLPFPANGASGGAAPSNPVDRFIQQDLARSAARPNPLNPLNPPGAASQPSRSAA